MINFIGGFGVDFWCILAVVDALINENLMVCILYLIQPFLLSEINVLLSLPQVFF